jgi:hypothetical protein
MSHSLIRRLALAGTAAVGAFALATPRLLRLGATKEEAHRPMPGDDEVPGAQFQGTRAVTINAPPEDVWPWIAQIGYHGYGRAGWYAMDRADNDGIESAWEIMPEFQHPEVGQVIGEEGSTIRAIEPNRLLLLSYHWPKTEWVWKQGLWPKFGHCSWAFVLEPLAGGRTRLIVRDRFRSGPVDLSVPFWPFFLVADLIVQPTMLRGIKRRVEWTRERSGSASRPKRSATAAPVEMRSRRSKIGLVLDTLSAIPIWAGTPLVRPWHMRWGAAHTEVAGPMPGDDIVRRAQFNATRAINIDAPPEQVWPWIAQLGYGRGGFYTYDLVDNAGEPSAERVIDEYQDLKVGDLIPMFHESHGLAIAYKVDSFEVNKWMVWVHRPHEEEEPDSTWTWRLNELPRGGTRLVTRMKQDYRWQTPRLALFNVILMEFGDFAMERRMLKGIRVRAERLRPT